MTPGAHSVAAWFIPFRLGPRPGSTSGSVAWVGVRDWVLLAICGLAIALGCYGMWWGWVECWNPDQMAQAPLRLHWHGLLPEPVAQLKPPFHTYLNHFLINLPYRWLSQVIHLFTGSYPDFRVAILYCSRLLQIALFAGCVYTGYRIARRAWGRGAGRVAALVIATGAGFVLQAHFLTADIPVTYWMLLAFFAAQAIATTGRLRDYVLAGLLTGIATATKYNGLAVGIALPLFHWHATAGQPFLHRALDHRLVLGVGAVAVGFLLADPYAVLNWHQFSTDFYYNYVTTPVYDGQDPHLHSFVLFTKDVVEIVGLPVALILLAAALTSPVRVAMRGGLERATVWAAWGVLLLYFAKFGGMPRLEVRFVVPAVPFFILAAAPVVRELLVRYRRVGSSLLVAVTAYNLVASVWVGYRFAHDARMAATTWVAAHVPPAATIESSFYTPFWALHPTVRVRDTRMPDFFAKRDRLSQVFASDPAIQELIRRSEPINGVEWYTADALARRRPDFIAVDSLYFRRFLLSPGAQAYPAASRYFSQLLDGRLGYRIVFDASSPGSPRWLYPREIGSVDNRFVLLERADRPASPAPGTPAPAVSPTAERAAAPSDQSQAVPVARDALAPAAA